MNLVEECDDVGGDEVGRGDVVAGGGDDIQNGASFDTMTSRLPDLIADESPVER